MHLELARIAYVQSLTYKFWLWFPLSQQPFIEVDYQLSL